MDIICPKCNFSKSVDTGKIPDRPVKVNCPKCSEAFTFDKSARKESSVITPPEQTTCPVCGLDQTKGEECDGCGVNFSKFQNRQIQKGSGKGNEVKSTNNTKEKTVHAHRIICSACGTVQAPSSQCLQCGATIVTTAERAQYSYAGFWIRVVASLLDSFLLSMVQFILTLIIGLSVGALGIRAENDPAVSMIIWLFGVTISLGYAVFFTGYCGQTPGKMAVRIKVIHTDGNQINYGGAVKREILGKFVSSILLGIGYIMVAFDNQKQGLHDKIANTYVIKL